MGSCYAETSLKTKLIRSIYEPLQRAACRSANLTIFQNNDDLKEFIDMNLVASDKAIVIPGSGVDSEKFARARIGETERQNLRQALKLRPDELVVTMVARVCRSKGVMEFAAAAAHVHQSHPNVRFLLVGMEDTDAQDRLTLRNSTCSKAL